MKILIVDDEPLILRGLVKVVGEIAPAGTQIRDAGSAPEALEAMVEFLPDVTITDINMPEKNGFELIEEARKEGLCERFIILTGYDEFEYVRQALRTGVVDYLLKPIDKIEIAALLTQVKDELPEAHDSEYSRHAEWIISYTQNNFRMDISLDHLASKLNLHPNYISSLFKKETGDTFVNYLNTLRIREAQRMLIEQPQIPAVEIGKQVGFESKHYFTKVFKKFTGQPPGAYRQDK